MRLVPIAIFGVFVALAAMPGRAAAANPFEKFLSDCDCARKGGEAFSSITSFLSGVARSLPSGGDSPNRSPSGQYLQASDWIPSGAPEIQALAREITRGAANDLEKSRKIFLWVTREIKYDDAVAASDRPGEGADVLRVLSRRRAVCGGYAGLSVALHRAAGIPARAVNGYSDPSYSRQDTGPVREDPRFRHYWTEVLLDGKWQSQEATWGSTACRTDACRLRYFNVASGELERDHLRVGEVDF